MVRAGGVEKIAVQPDGSLLAVNPTEGSPGNYALRAQTGLSGITAIKLEMLPDDRLPSNGPGLAPDGNFVLSEFTVSAAPQDAKRARQAAVPVTLRSPKADFEQANFAVTESLKKGNRDRGWAVSPETGFRHEAVFSFDKPVGFQGGTVLNLGLTSFFQNGRYKPGKFRFWVTTSPLVRFGTPQVLAEAVRTPAAQRTPAQTAALREHFLTQSKEYQGQKKALAAAKRPLPVDPQLVARQTALAEAQKPVVLDPKLVQLRRDAGLSAQQLSNKRLTAAQDLAWALINSPAFLFNH